MYECMNCMNRTLVWDNDFSFEDYCMEGEGIVHVYHCTTCGAEVEMYTREDGEE